MKNAFNCQKHDREAAARSGCSRKTAKVEALYYDLDSQSVGGQFSPLINPAAPNSIAIVNGATTTFNYQGVIAHVGVNYQFDWRSMPVDARF